MMMLIVSPVVTMIIVMPVMIITVLGLLIFMMMPVTLAMRMCMPMRATVRLEGRGELDALEPELRDQLLDVRPLL